MDDVLFNAIILVGLVVVFQHKNDICIMLEVRNNQISISIATYFPP
jgi:hypothetical protein